MMEKAILFLEKKVKEFDKLAEKADAEKNNLEYVVNATNAHWLEFAIQILKDENKDGTQNGSAKSDD